MRLRLLTSPVFFCAIVTTVTIAAGCGGGSGGTTGDDGGVPDAGPPEPKPTTHCHYEPVAPNANASGALEAGAVTVGTASEVLDVPLGTTLGAYTARADFSGSIQATDRRIAEISGAFHASIGIETRPRVRAVAITAGSETLVIAKVDLGMPDENMLHEVTRRLGPAYEGKVLLSASHSHSGWGQYMNSAALGVGFGRFRKIVYDRITDAVERAARAALAAREPAKIGVSHDGAFDPENRVSRDRRDENNDLPNGDHRKDNDLFVIRIDRMDGTPLAILPIVGFHGTLLDADNTAAATDAPGALERGIEEAFDREVMVMHLQGAAGDVSPAGMGGVDCGDLAPRCQDYAHVESIAYLARTAVLAAWERAGASMTSTMPLEVVTHEIPLGPDWRTFTVRGGALSYSPWDGRTRADRRVFDDRGALLSPIDEFNAPWGAALCGSDADAVLYRGQLPGTGGPGLIGYRSCVALDEAAETFGILLDLPHFDLPECASTRATLSAVRFGDYLVATLPGEPVTLLADALRSHSPAPANKTIVLGYTQGEVGYILTAEDWVRGGFEPSINFWGPLEGEYLMERSLELLQLVANDTRDDGAVGSTTRWVADTSAADTIPGPDPAPMAGTVPASVPELVYVPAGPIAADAAQPRATMRRLELTRFVWIGEDPLVGTPSVTLQRETTEGAFVDVTRRSGRKIDDLDLILYWTPDPLRRVGTNPRTHYYAVEWQAVGTSVAGRDELEDRVGLPVGRYRFHVVGHDYTIDSRPFDVTPTALSVTASRSGTNVMLDVGYQPDEHGFRLLSLTSSSNRRVPVVSGALTVEATLEGGGTRTFEHVTVTNGHATLAEASNVTQVRVVDAFDNAGTATVSAAP